MHSSGNTVEAASDRPGKKEKEINKNQDHIDYAVIHSTDLDPVYGILLRKENTIRRYGHVTYR